MRVEARPDCRVETVGPSPLDGVVARGDGHLVQALSWASIDANKEWARWTWS